VSSAIFAVLFLAAASALAVDVKEISESNFQKTNNLSYTTLEAAVVKSALIIHIVSVAVTSQLQLFHTYNLNVEGNLFQKQGNCCWS
jgi:hypothetical protein